MKWILIIVACIVGYFIGNFIGSHTVRMKEALSYELPPSVTREFGFRGQFLVDDSGTRRRCAFVVSSEDGRGSHYITGKRERTMDIASLGALFGYPAIAVSKFAKGKQLYLDEGFVWAEDNEGKVYRIYPIGN